MSTTSPPEDPRDALFAMPETARGLGRKAGGASVFILAMSALRVLLQLGSIAVIARLIPPAEYGIFAMALPGVMLAMALSSFGLPQAVIQKPHITHAQVSTLFWANVALGVIATGVVVGLAVPAAAWFDEPRVTPVFQAIGLSVLFSAVAGQYIAIMRRTLRIQGAEIAVFVAELVGIAIAVTAALAGLSYWALVLQQLAAPLLTIALLVAVTGWYPSSPRHADFRDARGSLVFGGFVAGYSILNKMTAYSGTVIVGAQFGAAATGLFYRARHLGVMPQRRIMVPLSGVFIPTLSRLQDDAAQQRVMFRRLISRANLILLPVAVMLAAGADQIVALLLGETWAQVAPLLFWMSLFTLRAGAASGLQHLLIACGQSRALFNMSIIRLGLVATAIYFAAHHGLEAAMAAYMLTEFFLVLPLLITLAQRHTPVGWAQVLRGSGVDMAFAAGLAALLILGLAPYLSGLTPLVHLTALGAVVAMVYGVRVLIDPSLRADVLQVLMRAVRRKA